MLTRRFCFATFFTLLLVGGCGHRVQPAAPAAPEPRPTAPVEEIPDAYVDLSAIARVLALPPAQQQAIWRTWARERSTDNRQNVAIAMLARHADPDDVPYILDAFERGDSKARRTAARALLAFGPVLTQHGRDRVYSSVQSAPVAATPETIWALVETGDARVYDLALARYRRGAFASVKTLDNHEAFDAALVGQLDLKQTLTLAQDQDPKLRQLVAQTCSRVAQTECTPWLVQLARDRVLEVRAAAVPGLVKIGSDETNQVLTQALRNANKDDREKLLIALRDEAGLAGLVAALDSVSPKLELGLEQTAHIFDLVVGRDTVTQTTLDPRGADALDDYMQHAPNLYSRTWAALALARLGDLRSVPVLAARLRLTPSKAYPGDSTFEVKLRRGDDERVLAARMLEQLAGLYPEHLPEIRRAAEDALVVYLQDPNYRHPSALAALSKLRSTKLAPRLRTWTNPTVRLPKPTDDFATFVGGDWRWIAESLRALGQLHDASSLAVLEKFLHRRPTQLDLTTHGLADDPNQALGVALCVLDSGAIGGLAEFGGTRAADALFAFADSPHENELTRVEACKGLAWTASEAQLRDVFERVRSLRAGTNTLDPRLHCFLQTFAARAATSLKPELLTLLEELSQASDIASGFLVAQALGRVGVGADDENRLLALLRRDDRSALPAALALLAGARPEIAQVAALRVLGRSAAQQTELTEAYGQMLTDLTEEDLRGGALYRWVTNAYALDYLGARCLEWSRVAVAQRLTGLIPELIAHPMSPLQFRLSALQAAQEGNTAATGALLAAAEGGALLSLRDTPGPGSHAAHRAYQQLRHRSATNSVGR